MRTDSLADQEVLDLYHVWSENFYAASFLTPSKEAVFRFRKWLRRYEKRERKNTDYEDNFLEEYRRQEKNFNMCWCRGTTCNCDNCEDLENGESKILCCDCHFREGEKSNESNS